MRKPAREGFLRLGKLATRLLLRAFVLALRPLELLRFALERAALPGVFGLLAHQTRHRRVSLRTFMLHLGQLCGGLNPIGTIFASFFIQHITAGGAYVDKSIYCSQVSDLISSLIIYLCAFVLFLKTAMNRWIFLHEERKAKKAAKTEKGGEA